MKLNTAKKSLESAGMNINVDFGIDMDGKAFSVLSDGLYSDIIPTIVRELSSNAYDSHVAAGKPDVPFEVGCPNAFDPYFNVKDFGTGLRYYRYTATVVNEHDGESTVFIDGDIREQIAGINLIVVNDVDTVKIGAILFDNTEKKTVIRIPQNLDEGETQIEFDDTLVLYSTYFRSTKGHSNDFIGAFGLGSKTPFAYTDNFLVINRFNGFERVYNILTNVDNKPQINLMGTNETDEGNGLEVKLAVAAEDFRAFKDAIRSQLLYFDPLPTVCNDTVKFPVVVHRGKHFLLLDTNDMELNYHESRLCVGNNAYTSQKVSSALFRQSGGCVLRFAVGELMVTASREKLKYDEQTIQLIRDREQQAIAEYTEYVLDTIDSDNMTDIEKVRFLNDNKNGIDLSLPEVRKRVGNPHLVYKHNSIYLRLDRWGSYIDLVYEDKTEYNSATGDYDVVGKVVNSYRSRLIEGIVWHKPDNLKESVIPTMMPDDNILIFVKDNPYSYVKKIKYYREEVYSGDAPDQVLIADVKKPAALEAVRELLTNATFVNVSDIEVPKNISTVASSSCPTPVARMFDPKTDRFTSNKFWTDVYTPLTKIDTDAYIVKTHRYDILGLDHSDARFLEQYFRSDMSYDPDIVILGIPRAKYAKALDYGFKPLSDLITELKSNVVIPVDYANRRAIEDDTIASDILFDGTSGSQILNTLSRFDAEMLKEIKHTPVGKLFRLRQIIRKRYADSNRLDQIVEMLDHFSADEIPEPSKIVLDTIDKLPAICDNITEKMILVNNVSTYYMSDEVKRAIIDYIKLVYSTQEKAND